MAKLYPKVLLLLLSLTTGIFFLDASAQTPTITSFSPASGAPGTLIRVKGSNLANVEGLKIGNTSGLLLSKSDTMVVGYVMPETQDGKVLLVNGGSTYESQTYFVIKSTVYPTMQDGQGFEPTDRVNPGEIYDVGISDDGNTLVFGGADNRSIFSASVWVFTKKNGVWQQQGAKLTGAGYTSSGLSQGSNVSISSDGNTIAFSSANNDNGKGSVWVFVRNDDTWTQQAKLDGTGKLGTHSWESDVSLSADGNTLITGGFMDNDNLGAAWIYKRTNGLWSQQGAKIVDSNPVPNSRFGAAVSISADGNTVLIARTQDYSYYVYSQENNIWSQQGPMLITDQVPQGEYMFSVSISLSANGNVAVAGQPRDNEGRGKIWVFTRSGSIWTTQGTRLATPVYESSFGSGIDISADGNIIVASGSRTGGNKVIRYLKSGTSWEMSDYSFSTTMAAGHTGHYARVALSGDGTSTMITNGREILGFSSDKKISAFSPLTGRPGTLVTISGLGLEKSNNVNIGGKDAILVSANDSSVVAMVMPGTTNGLVKLIYGTDTITSAYEFNISPIELLNGRYEARLINSPSIPIGHSSAINAYGDMVILGAPQGAGAGIIYRQYGNWQRSGFLLEAGSAIGSAKQGSGIDMSVDGQTIIVGGENDNNGIGGAWIYNLDRNFPFPELGQKLIANDAVGQANMGSSVGLSADGNTALVFGKGDNGFKGAAWIFTRNNGLWTQQGQKLVPNDISGTPNTIDYSAADLSADGNTVIIGGPGDDNNAGAAWIFSRTGNSWTQQGSKLVGSGSVGNANQGWSVSLNADGNTAIVGGKNDNSSNGAVWVFTRDNGVWSQQGNKITVTNNLGAAGLGQSVALTADGDIALVGGSNDNEGRGAGWVFRREQGIWQSVAKHTGTVVSGKANVGHTVSISPDGRTFGMSGPKDNGSGTQGVFYLHRHLPLNHVNTLSNLSFTGGVIRPTFNSNLQSYTSSVAYSLNSVQIKATLTDPNSTVTVNGSSVSDNTLSPAISLVQGSNIFVIKVIAQDTTVSKFYTLNINRLPISTISTLSSISLSSGTLSPTYSSSTKIYTAGVSNQTASIKITPTVTDTTARVKVNGVSVISGNASTDISLNVGSNTITMLVTAEDGISTSTYTLTVTRAAADQAAPDANGNSTVSSTTPQVLITSPTVPVTVTVPAGLTTASLNYSSMISSGTGILPQTTVNSPLASVSIPASTKVTSSNTSWNGVLNMPSPTTHEIPNSPGEVTSFSFGVEVGSQDASLEFDKAIRLVLPGQAGKRAGFVRLGVFTEITTIGSTDSQTEGDALPAKGACKIDAGADLVIWTKGFSKFITFTSSVDPNIALLALDKAALTESSIQGNNSGLQHVVNSLIEPLPLTGSNGSSIIWTSSHPSLISASGMLLSRPEGGDVQVTLTATLKKGLITDTKVFTVIVAGTLPLNNIKIQSTAVSCKGSSNGAIIISAVEALNYTATVTGAISKTLTFSNSLNIQDLSPGTYNICITASGLSTYKQCFDLVITEPKDLAAYAVVNKEDKTITLDLSGGSLYMIELNGKLYSTDKAKMLLNLEPGDNRIKVSTDKICQGVVEHLVNIARPLPYPNPFENMLSIELGNKVVKNLIAEIQDLSGRISYREQFSNQSGALNLNVSNLGSGVYLLRLSLDNKVSIHKVMKK